MYVRKLVRIIPANLNRASDISSLVGSAVRIMTLTDCWPASGIACRAAGLRQGCAMIPNNRVSWFFEMAKHSSTTKLNRPLKVSPFGMALIEALKAPKAPTPTDLSREEIISQTEISKLTSGRRHPPNLTPRLRNLADRLGYDPEEMFAGRLAKTGETTADQDSSGPTTEEMVRAVLSSSKSSVFKEIVSTFYRDIGESARIHRQPSE